MYGYTRQQADGGIRRPGCPEVRLRAPRELLAETDRYLAELIEEVGEPSPAEVAEADVWCDRIKRHLEKAPGSR